MKFVSPPVEHEPGTHKAFLRLTPWGDYFFAQAFGRRMEPDLCNGAMLEIERTKDVREGEIVVFRVGSGLALKRLAFEDGRMVLRPDNPEFEPIYADEEEDFEIFGVVRRWASWGEPTAKKKAREHETPPTPQPETSSPSHASGLERFRLPATTHNVMSSK